jgi:hypothetical protein
VVLSALVQLIICPFYRTLNGFSMLVQKEFNFFGHPFRSRLGFTSNSEEEIPIFVMFLDCVSQLINSNSTCFQFNYKYLSTLSNLMYTGQYGTFITNSRKETKENHVEEETVPIWDNLCSVLTMNAFYFGQKGILSVPGKLD